MCVSKYIHETGRNKYSPTVICKVYQPHYIVLSDVTRYSEINMSGLTTAGM